MAYNFYNISAGCPVQIDFNLKHCLPTDFIGKLVDTELKGRYKTVIPLSGDCKFDGHLTIFRV